MAALVLKCEAILWPKVLSHCKIIQKPKKKALVTKRLNGIEIVIFQMYIPTAKMRFNQNAQSEAIKKYHNKVCSGYCQCNRKNTWDQYESHTLRTS
jgi:hypothetical protein